MVRNILLLQLAVVLATTCCALEAAVGNEQDMRENSDELSLAQSRAVRTSSQAEPEKCTAFDTSLLGNSQRLCSASSSALKSEKPREDAPTSEKPKQERSKDDELIIKVFELRNTIRVLSAAHNDLLYSMVQSESRWVRIWLQMIWNYPLRYGRNDDTRLFDLLKRAGNFNFTSKADILLESDQHNPLLRGNVRQFLLDLPRQTGSHSVLDSLLVGEEEWTKWKTRLTQIKDEINLMQLKNAPYEYKDAVIEKLDGFLEDFYEQLFRTQIDWMYAKEGSWLEHAMESSAAKISHIKSSGTEKLQYASDTVTGTFANGKRALIQALAEQAMKLDDLGSRSQKNIHLWAGILQPFHVVVGNLSVDSLGFGYVDKFSGKLAAHSNSLAFALCGLCVLIAIHLFEERILALIRGTRRYRRTRNLPRRNRVQGISNSIGGDSDNNTVSSSILPIQQRRAQPRFQAQRRLPNPLSLQPEVVVLDDEDEPHQPGGDADNRSTVSITSFKRSSNYANRRTRNNLTSISDLGPVRRPAVTDSLRVGNRRINVRYEGRRNRDNHDEDDEVIAIVQSAKENHQKKPLSIAEKKTASRNEGRKGMTDSQTVFDSVSPRTTRPSRDTKGSLADASNSSLSTDQTRALRSEESTRTTDVPTNRHGAGSSSLPRRRSARLSTPHSKRNLE